MTQDSADKDDTMTDNTLMPCPFDGGTGVIDFQFVNKDTETRFFVRCKSCACEGGWSKSESGAIRLWNTRAVPAPPHTEERG